MAELRCGVILSTEGAISDVENWLKDHCAGDWELALEDMDEDLVKKSLKILFEREEDKLLFTASHAKD